jgi:CRP-like cAMP-binding protein
VATLAQTAVRKQLARGDRFWRAGSPATHFAIIASGLMKISRRTADGTDAIVAIFGPRESIGDVAVVRRTPYPADAIAASATAEMLLVDAPPVLEVMRSNARVADAINQSLALHTEALQEKIKIMTAGSVPQRLATLLLHLAERFGDELDDGTTFLPVALTRIELAQLVSATVETTIRAVSRWQKQGWIETTHDGFRLRSTEPLAKIASGERVDE